MASCSEYVRAYTGRLTGLLQALDPSEAARIADILDDACRQRRTIFCIGNGGSAATASHFATDLTWGRRAKGEVPPRAISLTVNSPLTMAVANDVGYGEVFVEQLRGLFEAGDVLFAISASGNSENILKAVQYVNVHDGVSIGLVGFDGGKMKSACRTCLHVETPIGMYELVEDVHHAVCHILASYLKRKNSLPFRRGGEGR